MDALLKILPKKYGRLFLDESAFNLTPDEQNAFGGKEERKLNPNYYDATRLRLRRLNNYLGETDNWLTVEEIIGERRIGIMRMRDFSEKLRDERLAIATGKFLDESVRTLRMLEEEKRNVNKISSQRLTDLIYGSHLGWVKHKFYEFGGETGETEADCVLISAALAFARENQIYMFSHDKPLIRTFADRASNTRETIKKTYIIREEEGRVVTTKGYLREDKERKSK